MFPKPLYSAQNVILSRAVGLWRNDNGLFTSRKLLIPVHEVRSSIRSIVVFTNMSHGYFKVLPKYYILQ